MTTINIVATVLQQLLPLWGLLLIEERRDRQRWAQEMFFAHSRA
jgi:hypothetical protein